MVNVFGTSTRSARYDACIRTFKGTGRNKVNASVSYNCQVVANSTNYRTATGKCFYNLFRKATQAEQAPRQQRQSCVSSTNDLRHGRAVNVDADPGKLDGIGSAVDTVLQSVLDCSAIVFHGALFDEESRVHPEVAVIDEGLTGILMSIGARR